MVLDGWMGGWVGGWVDGRKSRFKDCLQQSKTCFSLGLTFIKTPETKSVNNSDKL